MTSPFVQTYRHFPTDDPHNLEKQLVNFHQQTNIAVNNRTISTFSTNAIPDGERWFPAAGSKNMNLRDGNRKVLQFASILNGVTTIPHEITWTHMTRIYGTAENPSMQGIPLEHATATEVVSLSYDETNVYITTTTSNWTSYSGTIVIEYI